MTAPDILFWFVLCSSAIGLAELWGSRRSEHQSWRLVFGALMGVCLVGRVAGVTSIGYIVGCLWLLFVLLPLTTFRRCMARLARFDYAGACRSLRLVVWLHPGTHWHNQLQLWEAQAKIQQHDLAGGLADLADLRHEPGALGMQATLHYYRLRGQWQELRFWLETNFLKEEIAGQPEVLPLFLRALGEVGAVDEMLRLYHLVSPSLRQPALQHPANLSRLIVGAFSGRPDLVLESARQLRPALPPERQEFWLATAYLAAGARTAGLALLHDLEATADGLLRQEILGRLDRQPTRPGSAEPPQYRMLLRDMEEDMAQAAEQNWRLGEMYRPGRVIHIIFYLNLLFFFVETISGGSTNEETLYRLGGLVTQAVLEDHQWWRLATAAFLHAGILHIGFNMLGLYIIGPLVRARLGSWRFLVVYVGAGLGSMGFLVLMDWLFGYDQFVVGASGCVMGLVGALAAIYWRAWRQSGLHGERLRLVTIVLIIVFQTAFDLSHPEVSFLAHMSGACIGLVLTCLVRHRSPHVAEEAVGEEA